MTEEWRDPRVPYTEEELQELKRQFQLLKTYENGYCLPTDFQEIGEKMMRLDYSEAKVAALTELCEEKMEGKMPMDVYIECVRAIHNTGLYSSVFLHNFDPKKTGFISVQDFETCFKYFVVHDLVLSVKSMQDFIQDLGAEANGKVSIEDCTNWIGSNTAEKWVPNPEIPK